MDLAVVVVVERTLAEVAVILEISGLLVAGLVL
jgi:hypothetical protein